MYRKSEGCDDFNYMHYKIFDCNYVLRLVFNRSTHNYSASQWFSKYSMLELRTYSQYSKAYLASNRTYPQLHFHPTFRHSWTNVKKCFEKMLTLVLRCDARLLLWPRWELIIGCNAVVKKQFCVKLHCDHTKVTSPGNDVRFYYSSKLLVWALSVASLQWTSLNRWCHSLSVSQQKW